MDNLELYNKYRNPPKNALKAFNNGRFSGTDINPMWRIKSLTETFGPCGVGWYTEVLNRWSEAAGDSVCVFVEAALYIKWQGEWSKPIIGVGGNTFVTKTKDRLLVSDEAYKMAYTDAVSIACKALGFGADIWWDKDETKYTARKDGEYIDNPTKDDFPEPVPQPKEPEIVCKSCGAPINPVRKNGELIPAAKVASGCGGLCYDCYKFAKAAEKEQKKAAQHKTYAADDPYAADFLKEPQ